MSDSGYVLSEFTPAEAEDATGISVTLQRAWRRRGYLPRNSGHARFNVFDLAEMLAMALFSERGIQPQRSHKFSRILGDAIASRALEFTASYENWSEGTDPFIGRQICADHGRRHDNAEFLIFWADDSFDMTNDLNSSFVSGPKNDQPSNIRRSKKQREPVIVFDIYQIGAEFAPVNFENWPDKKKKFVLLFPSSTKTTEFGGT